MVDSPVNRGEPLEQSLAQRHNLGMPTTARAAAAPENTGAARLGLTTRRSPAAIRWRRAVLFAAAALLTMAARAAGEDFYETRLLAGVEALRANRPLEAVNHLRIASFGFLDRPPLLSESLACLALAQEKAGRVSDEEATLARFVEVERRFAPYAQANLDSALRGEFESLIRRRLPQATLRSLAAFGDPAAARQTPAPARGTATAPALATSSVSPGPPIGTDGNYVDPEGVDRLPRIKTAVKPVYPAAALSSRSGGTVVLRVLVSETGLPLLIDVVRGIRPDLADAAIAAVKKWTFQPARKGNGNVRTWTSVSVPFEP